jgi:hypothetical protein
MSHYVTPNAPTPHTDELAIAALHCPAGVSFLTQNAGSYSIEFGTEANYNAFITAVAESFIDETTKAAILSRYQS